MPADLNIGWARKFGQLWWVASPSQSIIHQKGPFDQYIRYQTIDLINTALPPPPPRLYAF